MNDMVSVVVAVYNAQKYLDACIAGICSQTYTNLQIILIDDGSTDKSPEICEKWGKKDSRIVIRHLKNGGVSRARNEGIQFAEGNYITFVDSDDWIESDFIETLVCNHKKDFFTCCGYMAETLTRKGKHVVRPVRYSKKETEKIVKQNVLSIFSLGLFQTVWNKLYEVTLLRENKIWFPLEYSLGEDIIFNLRYLRVLQGEITVSNRLCYHYMIRYEGSLSQKYYEDFCDIQKIIYEMLLSYLVQVKAEKTQVQLARQLYFNALIVSFDNLYRNKKSLGAVNYGNKYSELVCRQELPTLVADMDGWRRLISSIRWMFIRHGLFRLDFYLRTFIKKILRLE